MVDQIIRPSALPRRTNPVASEIAPVDNGVQVAGSTLAEIVNAGRPVASRAEAEAGVNAEKSMAPLTVKQSIASEVGVTLASKAQGDKADSAIQAIFGAADISIDSTDPTGPVIYYTGAGVADGDKGDVIVSGSGSDWQLSSAAKGRLVGVAADRTALAAMSGSTYQAVDLMEAGRKGLFQWDGSDLSDEVTNDPAQGIYVAPTSDATGASGAWVRVRDKSMGLLTTWFKGAGDTSEAQSINAAIALALYLDETKVRMPGGVLSIDDPVVVNRDIELIGAGTNRPTGVLVGTVLKQAANVNIIETSDGFNVKLRDFSIEGDPDNYSSGWGIYAYDASYQIDITDITIHKTISGGVYAVNLYKANFTRLVIQRCLGWGMHLDGFVNNFVMLGGEVSGCGTYPTSGGVRLSFYELEEVTPADHNQIPLFLGVTLEGNKYQGVRNISGHVKFESCYVEANRDVGIYVEGGSVTTAHNWFRSNDLYDIRSVATGTAYPNVISIGDVFSGVTNCCVAVNNRAFDAVHRVGGVVRDPIFLEDVTVRYGSTGSMEIQDGGVHSSPYHTNANLSTIANQTGASANVMLAPHDNSGRLHRSFRDGHYLTYFLAVSYGTAAPTTGTHTRGKIVLNQAPTAGGALGWICVTAGTPGTWKSIGSIAA